MNKSTLVPREEMNDLDWLARNVHVWPCGKHQPWCYVVTKIDGKRTWASNALSSSFPYSLVDKDKWLARRAELQNKPSWDDFGESAKFMAQDSDGAWMAFESEPAANYHVWSSMRGWCGYAREGRDRCRGEVLGDWRDTLEKRPEQSEFEQFVSVEDAKITIMQSDGDVKHFGGIIGRRLPLEEDAATAKNCDQVVTINIKPDSTLIHQPRGRIKRITTSKYTKTIHGVSVDVYDVLQAWCVSNPALQHLIKKALQCGHRGHKDNAQDLQDIIDSAIRAKELES